MYKREEWMGEVGDGGKVRDITREEGFGLFSEDSQGLGKKKYCYQLLSVFITVHNFLLYMSDCLCRPAPLGASHQSTPAYTVCISEITTSSVNRKNMTWVDF